MLLRGKYHFSRVGSHRNHISPLLCCRQVVLSLTQLAMCLCIWTRCTNGVGQCLSPGPQRTPLVAQKFWASESVFKDTTAAGVLHASKADWPPGSTKECSALGLLSKNYLRFQMWEQFNWLYLQWHTKAIARMFSVHIQLNSPTSVKVHVARPTENTAPVPSLESLTIL